MNPGLYRTAAIIVAIVAGSLLPQAHVLSPAIRWLVMGMLFLVFLQTRVSREAVRLSHLWLLLGNLAMALASWAVGWALGGRDVALAAFFAGVAPTAAAAPIIISFLHGKVEYVIASFVVTNLAITALLPFLLPLMLGHATPDFVAQVLGSVTLVVFAPMALAWLLRRVHPPAAKWPKRVPNLSFGMWIGSMTLIMANASNFLRQHAGTPHVLLAQVVGVTIVVCAANFAIGRLIGGREFGREASQSLGQKNTSYVIYLALAYASPLVALGPTFYVVWHNLWNSWQLRKVPHSRPGEPGK